jgi:hypothetical protein
MDNRRFPFQNLDARAWQNLALVAIFTIYIVQIGSALITNDLFNSLGFDYRAFWSVGRIANTQGYPYIYDLELQAKTQQPIVQKTPKQNFLLNTTVFLPIFILPFQVLGLLDIDFSFWLWTIVNLAGLILYLQFFTQSVFGSRLPTRMMAFLLLGFPIYDNFFMGQVNVWLLICTGEFLRATLNRKPLAAGLWLGGLMIKPQTLIIVIPALLLNRSWKTLLGFVSAASFILIVSIGLVGPGGMIQLTKLWLGYVAGMPSNFPDNMMNWRMLGFHLSRWIAPGIGGGIAVVGTLATILAGLYLWLRPLEVHSPEYSAALLGTLAATCAATWHSHLHMALLLIPLLVYTNMQKMLPDRFLTLWAFFSSSVMFATLLLSALMVWGGSPLIPGFGGLLLGLSGLALNLFLLAWSIQFVRARGLAYKVNRSAVS